MPYAGTRAHQNNGDLTTKRSSVVRIATGVERLDRRPELCPGTAPAEGVCLGREQRQGPRAIRRIYSSAASLEPDECRNDQRYTSENRDQEQAPGVVGGQWLGGGVSCHRDSSLLDGEHFESVADRLPEKTMLGALYATSHGLWQPISKTGIYLPNSKRFVVVSCRWKAAAMTVAIRPSSLAHRSTSCEQRGRRGPAHVRRS